MWYDFILVVTNLHADGILRCKIFQILAWLQWLPIRIHSNQIDFHVISLSLFGDSHIQDPKTYSVDEFVRKTTSDYNCSSVQSEIGDIGISRSFTILL